MLRLSLLQNENESKVKKWNGSLFAEEQNVKKTF